MGANGSDRSEDARQSELSAFVRQLLERTGKRQSEVADAAEINRSQLSQFLQGSKTLGRESLIALAAALEVPATQLLQRGGFEASLLDSSDVLLTRSTQVRSVPVISDARFVDSALFAWLVRQQPLRAFGVVLEFQQVDWDSVPGEIEKAGGFGFYNRRATMVRGAQKLWSVERWTDLAMYKGYAILAHKSKRLAKQPQTRADAIKFISSVIAKRRAENRQATILTFGNDVEWRVGVSLAPELSSADFEVIPLGDADQALEKFTQDDSGNFFDFFIGGLPQRLHAEQDHDAVPVLSFTNNRLFFSLNSLVYAERFLDAPKARAILTAMEALWFDTNHRIRTDPEFRSAVIHSIPMELDALGLSNRTIDEAVLSLVLPGPTGDNTYELFPARPIELMDEIVRITEALTKDLKTKEQIVGALSHLRTALGDDVPAPHI